MHQATEHSDALREGASLTPLLRMFYAQKKKRTTHLIHKQDKSEFIHTTAPSCLVWIYRTITITFFSYTLGEKQKT